MVIDMRSEPTCGHIPITSNLRSSKTGRSTRGMANSILHSYSPHPHIYRPQSGRTWVRIRAV
eukprot:4167370-Lingulodinium_polyedra.AAC.1